jgi:hypothetical protein
VSQDELVELSDAWRLAKHNEQAYAAERREIEDRMLSMLGVSEMETGTKKFGKESEVTIVFRHNQTIDSEMVKQIAAERDMVEHASQLFRWKAEVNKKVWDATDPSLQSVFSPAITTKPGRPSFTISTKDN